MGIKNLNTLLENATQYSGKFDTIIIDGSNLLITNISAVVSSIKKDNYYAPWDTFNLDLIQTLYKIINQTTDGIILNLFSITRSLLNKGGKIKFVVDSSTEPSYITYNNKILQVKAEEKKSRKQKQDRTEKINKQLELIKLEYGIYQNGICINEDEIINLFSQLDYFNNPGNYLSLTSIILNNIMKNVSNNNYLSETVTFIRAISEADFVIKNLANIYNDKPVLVMSEDTDYVLLLSDIENAYKTSIKTKQAIYYPYEFWKTTINDQITYDELIYITTLIGNDYVNHQTILTLDGKNSEKNINKIKGMCNIDNYLETDIRYSLMKKIKPLLVDFNPNSLSTVDDFEDIFKKLDENYNNAILIYNSWLYNFDFEELIYKENLFETSLEKILNRYKQTFNCVITFDKYELDNCIKCTFKNKLSQIVSQIKKFIDFNPDISDYHYLKQMNKFKIELLSGLNNDIYKRKIQNIDTIEALLSFVKTDLSYLNKFQYVTNFQEYYEIIMEDNNDCYLKD